MLAMAVEQSDTAINGTVCSGARAVTLLHLGAVLQVRAKVTHLAVCRQQMENLVILARELRSTLKSDSDARVNLPFLDP